MSFSPADKPVYPHTDPFTLVISEDWRIGLMIVLERHVENNWDEIEPDDFNALAALIESLDRYDRVDVAKLREEYAEMLRDEA